MIVTGTFILNELDDAGFTYGMCTWQDSRQSSLGIVFIKTDETRLLISGLVICHSSAILV